MCLQSNNLWSRCSEKVWKHKDKKIYWSRRRKKAADEADDLFEDDASTTVRKKKSIKKQQRTNGNQEAQLLFERSDQDLRQYLKVSSQKVICSTPVARSCSMSANCHERVEGFVPKQNADQLVYSSVVVPERNTSVTSSFCESWRPEETKKTYDHRDKLSRFASLTVKL